MFRTLRAAKRIGDDSPRSPSFLESVGFCPTCNQEVTFSSKESWLRDHFLCSNCGSIPRERALMAVIDSFYPRWRDLVVHESSPVDRGASTRLARECPNYIASHYFPEQPSGTMVGNYRCENLEAMTFGDETIDLHITQDVLEHVFHPERVFAEIARTLRAGGAHIFTTPLVNKHKPSEVRAVIDQHGNVSHLAPPEYHGNPISESGSLVTVHWGYDICEHIHRSSGLFTHVVYIDDLSRGIRAEYIEVLVTVKAAH